MDIFLKTIGSINDETRIKILNFIDINGEVCVCDIEKSFDMIQSRVSRHLKILKDGGFLKVIRKGRWAFYSIRTPMDKFRQNVVEEIKYLNLDLPKFENSFHENKKVLVLCTGNSCRSIIAEALINSFLNGVKAKSTGVKASGKVNSNAKKVLKENNIWDESYHSKTLDTIIDENFDLIVTVCDNAHENCPIFPKSTPKIHINFEDPDGKDYIEFTKIYEVIKIILLPKVKEALSI